MNQPIRLTLAFILFLKLGDVAGQVARTGDINLLPMYGGQKKSLRLQYADAKFLTYCDQHFPNRKEAAAQFAQRGWDFYYANDYATAIKRYNEAWLLDSTNASAYWGFGVIEGERQHNTDALHYFQLSLRHDPTNRRVHVDIAQALISRYALTRQSADLASAIGRLQLYLTDTTDAKGTIDAYKRMAAAYYFQRDYPSAWKYVDLATVSNPAETKDWELITDLQKAAPR